MDEAFIDEAIMDVAIMMWLVVGSVGGWRRRVGRGKGGGKEGRSRGENAGAGVVHKA
jgi:hypothetical protein